MNQNIVDTMDSMKSKITADIIQMFTITDQYAWNSVEM